MASKTNSRGLSLRFAKPRLSHSVAAKLKAEVARIGANGTRQGRNFAQKMLEAYAELQACREDTVQCL